MSSEISSGELIRQQFSDYWNNLQSLANGPPLRANLFENNFILAVQLVIPKKDPKWAFRLNLTAAEARTAFAHFDPFVRETGTHPSYEQLLAYRGPSMETGSESPVSGTGSGTAQSAPYLFVSLVSGETAGGVTLHYEGTMKAFDKVPFVAGGYVSLFRRHVASCALGWNDSGAYYSPFLAMINSSMTGKSRLALEMCNFGVFVFPICLRKDKDRRMRPPRTPYIADWATASSVPLDKARDLYPFTNQGCVLFHRCLELLDLWLLNQLPSLSPTVSTATPLNLTQVPNQQPKSVKELATQWAEHLQENGDAFWADVMQTMESNRSVYPEALSPPITLTTPIDPATARSIADAWRPKTETVKQRISKKLLLLDPCYGKGADADSRLQILFFIDEARQFARLSERDRSDDLFVWFRRSIRCLPFNFGSGKPALTPHIFCVVTDTTSSISNLSPALSDDESLRSLVEGFLLFEPFFLLKTQDLWWKEVLKLDRIPREGGDFFKYLTGILLQQAHELDWSAELAVEDARVKDRLSLQLMEQFWFMSLLGRPYHFSFFGCQATEGTGPAALAARDALVDLMKGKILNDRTFATKSDFKCSEVQALAVLCALAAVEISARSEKANTLSARHMRLLAGISIDRTKAYTIEPIDPILAMSARELVLTKKVAWHEMIDAITNEFRTTTEIGYRGELAAQTLLLMAWDRVLLDEDLMSNKNVLTNSIPLTPASETVSGDAASTRQLPRQAEFPAVPVMSFLEKLLARKIQGLKSADALIVAKAPSFAGVFPLLSLLIEAGSSDNEAWELVEVVTSLGESQSALQQLLRASQIFGLINRGRDAAEFLWSTTPDNVQEAFGKFSNTAVKPADVELLLSVFSGLENRKAGLSALSILSRVNVTAQGLRHLAVSLRQALEVLSKTEIFDAVRIRTSLRVLEDMGIALKDTAVRVHQFTKTFCRVNKKMLWEAFLRGVAIYCMENQPVIDLVIPFMARKGAYLSESVLSAIVIQIKLRKTFESENFKMSWLDNVLDLDLLNEDATSSNPFVAIFCEFGSSEDLDNTALAAALEARAVNQKQKATTRKRGIDGEPLEVTKPFMVPGSPTRGYALFTKGLSVLDLASDDMAAHEAFKRLVASLSDPSKSSDITEDNHVQIEDMFRTIAYLNRPIPQIVLT